MLHTELKSKIRKLWDKFWSGGISNPLQAIEQISYLIFMKKMEDKDILDEQNAVLKGVKYKSVFIGHENCRWSVWSEYSSDKILAHVRDVVFPFMRNLGEANSSYAKYMKDASFSLPTASLLIEAVNIINDLHIKEQNQDTQGDIYEYLLSELQSAGKNGQFRTPRHIIRMMVDLARPEFGDRILDPACGTAGFLVNAYEYILRTNQKNGVSTLTPQKKKILDEESLYGYDIDRTMVRIAVMNLMMHGITNPKIVGEDTLSKRYNENGIYDLILANPPFKGSINESEKSDELTISTSKTELLFLELMYNSLSVGGRCIVIVPEGVLFGNSNAHKSIKKLLLEKCRLDAVISMPSGIFKPYAGVSTAVLYFTKGEPTEKVWFYDMEADGYSLDDKRNEIKENDIPDILERFEKRKKEDNKDISKKSFFVSIDEIKANDFDLSINKYRKEKHEEVIHRNSKEIIKEAKKEVKELLEGFEELEKLV
ncbi:MAG: type I restriction enzyme M protein [archaeon GW2011_AR13]|nr:MAG: type I restriction enzyme M protein [archaeon GW2011_AR13]HIG94301.1 SAM-dependent DNA methyltransferase [Nanoarchaeota archaeon]HIH63070.1 SAM-dependent DNA methyltransferase [Nanoarchaeota archaeon]HIJ09503.1 SAM-dependent DNA methyltransferase [Nanoarchaeota archaeon]